MRFLIIIGGFFWIAVFIFDCFFWKIFKWNRDLGNLTPVNRAIMQVLNLSLMCCFLIFAFVSIYHADELITTGLGRSLLAGMAIFGVLRAIEQVIFFDLRPLMSRVFLVLVIVCTALYLVPLIGALS